MPVVAQDPKVRFRKKLVRAGSCLVWTGATDKDGYPLFQLGTRKTVRGHRWWREQHRGEIPDGMLVCHTCDNPPCCRMRHLFLGSHQDNIRDRDQKQRQSRGERHYAAKLSDAQVVELRERIVSGETTRKQAAMEYEVSYSHVKNLVLGNRRT